VRFIGLDVHRDFCEVAVSEGGKARSAGRVQSSPEELRVLGQSPLPDDKVILESTGNALEIARVLEPFVSEVVIANPMHVRAISHAKVKNDQFDARTLAELLAADLVPRVWIGDERTRVLRRLTSRRTQLVRQRTRPKNEISAVLVRNLNGRPPMSDLFGKRGRQWLAELELPNDERDTVEACLRQIDFLTTEIAHVDRQLAEQALQSDEIKRLMTIPGIDVTTAATLIAAIGDIHRFPSAKKLVGYLGIDPRSRQSGQNAPRQGRISKQGSSSCRHVLGEAAWSAVKTPGPLRAFYQRVRARRGAQVAIVATSRKLACLCWQLLTTEQDYAFKRQTTTANSGRSNSAPARPPGTAPNTPRARPRSNSATSKNGNSQNKPNSPINDSSRTGRPPQPSGMVRVPHRGAHHKGRQAAQQRGREQPQNLRFSSRSPAPPNTIPRRKESVHSTLDFHA
jgi:transposase